MPQGVVAAPLTLSLPVLWRVADAVSRMRGMLLEGAAAEWELGNFMPEIAAGAPEQDLRCRAALASTLVAGLELAREGTLPLEQPEPWDSVAV